MFQNDKNLAALALALLCLLSFAPAALHAQEPDFGGLLDVAYDETAAPVSSTHFELSRQTGDEPAMRGPVDRPWFDAIPAEFRSRIELLLADGRVAFVADAVTAAGTGKPEIILSHTARGAYFNHRHVVLSFENFNPRRRPDEAVDGKRVDEALVQTAVHELAHFLQFRLYGGWLPKVNYTGSEFSASGADGGHWFQKPTDEASAWCEGFAEAVAATLVGDARISHFEGRRVLHYGIRNPRPTGELERIEGYVACALGDFWAGEGQAERMTRSFAVIRGGGASGRRHQRFSAYLSDHLAAHPEDGPRWELALRANTSCRQGVRAMNADEVFAALCKEISADLVARACHDVLRTAAAGSSRNDLLRAVLRRARALNAAGESAYHPLGAEGERYEAMSRADLVEAIERAQAEFDGWFQKYGYDAHPSCKEARARKEALQAILARRRG